VDWLKCWVATVKGTKSKGWRKGTGFLSPLSNGPNHNTATQTTEVFGWGQLGREGNGLGDSGIVCPSECWYGFDIEEENSVTVRERESITHHGNIRLSKHHQTIGDEPHVHSVCILSNRRSLSRNHETPKPLRSQSVLGCSLSADHLPLAGLFVTTLFTRHANTRCRCHLYLHILDLFRLSTSESYSLRTTTDLIDW